MLDREALNKFYEEVSARDGMSVTVFHARLASLFADKRTTGDICDYRLGKKPWKKLRDEITPVSRFLQFYEIEADRVRFPLNNNPPDCWLLNDIGNDCGIEVTIERGREQHHLKRELNQTGIGRGFIGLQDDSSEADFANRMSSRRFMFSSEQALESTKAGIIRCLCKKNDPKYANIKYLLIQAHLITLPKERWSAITRELSLVAKNLPFQKIYVIGNADEHPCGFQIK